MGSRSKIDLAYIAGFLDGDGSLMIQIKKRRDGKSKTRFMLTICFYQDSRHEQSLYWIQKILRVGYIAKRNDGMTELRINGFSKVKEIIAKLLPHIKFKRKQASTIYQASCLLVNKKISELSKTDLSKLVDCIVNIQRENYATKSKKSRAELRKILGLTP